MKRYFKIYLFLLKLNYHRALIQRTNSINGIISGFSWGVFSILAIFILTQRSTSVFGWTRGELLVLIGVYNIMIGGIFRMVFAKNFDSLTQIVQHGELDGIMLKPLSSQFFLSTQYFSVYNIFRIIVAVVYTFLMLLIAKVQISLISILEFVPLLVLGVTVLYSMWFLLMTLSIWFPDLDNLVEIMYTTDNIARYPQRILWEIGIPLFFIFFPQTLIVSVPTKALLHKLSIFDSALLICLACGLLFISQKFWEFALKYYTSASG